MFKSHSQQYKDGESGLAAVIGSAPLILPLTSAFITTGFEQDYCAWRCCLYAVYVMVYVGVLLMNVICALLSSAMN